MYAYLYEYIYIYIYIYYIIYYIISLVHILIYMYNTCVHVYMSGRQNYLFPVIATGKTGSSPIGCEDFRSLITSSRKCCSMYYYK